MMSQQQSLLKRTTLKFSTDLPEAEIRKAISESMGIPIEQVPQFNFENEKARMRNEMKSVE